MVTYSVIGDQFHESGKGKPKSDNHNSDHNEHSVRPSVFSA